MSKATKKEMKTEALQRMKSLKLHPNPVNEFKKDGKLNASIDGLLYWLDEEVQKMVDEFESKRDCLVYHVIKTNTIFGELLSFLYVSSNKEDWKNDRLDLAGGFPLAYVINLSGNEDGEFGSIGIEPLFGGVIRTA